MLECARASRPRSHWPIRISLLRRVGIAARAPWISILRRYLLPAFRDPEEAWSSAGGDLTRNEAEPGRQITSAGESADIADRRDQRCGIEGADARDGGEPASALVGPSLFGELCVECCDAPIEGLPAFTDIRHQATHP